MTTDDEEFVDPEGAYVTRSAVIVKPKQPYADWANSLDAADPRFDLTDGRSRTRIYLVAEAFEARELADNLSECWHTIFDSELNGWTRRPSEWPKNRTLEMFLAWFEVEYCDSVVDLEDEEIERI